jgi:hypothetical protein
MAIEMRKSSRAYYRKERIGARVRSVYVAAGALGDAYAALDQVEREQRKAEQLDRRRARAAWEAEERDAEQLAAVARELERLALLATGHHQHKRTWRKRRTTMRGMEALQAAAAEELERRRAKAHRAAAAALAEALPALPDPNDDSDAAARAIMDRCNRADATPQDVEALRALMARRPLLLGDDDMSPIRQALNAEIERSGHALKRELVREHLEQRRAALGYHTAPALERGLINHLLVCEVRLGRAEHYFTAMETTLNVPIAVADHSDRRLSNAQRRYLAAVEALARVRRVRVELARVLPDGSAEAVAVERPGR